MTVAASKTEFPNVVGHAEWTAARKEFLKKEKEFSKVRDELSRMRRALPSEKVDKQYVFEGPNGKETLADLFGGRSQLVVYHFMLGPGWKEGCPSCSFIAESFDGAVPHLAARDTTLVAVSRAPLPEIEPFKKRMGWHFPWVSSSGSDFNFDYGVSFTKEAIDGGRDDYNYAPATFHGDERPGLSVFHKNAAGEIFHTYSTYARGLDILIAAYNYLDLTPKGRDEADIKPHAMAWVRHHDRYPNAGPTYSIQSTPAANASDSLLREFQEEAATTKRVLDRVPGDKLAWKPHSKSMSLGQLALHIARVPGSLAKLLELDELEPSPSDFTFAAPRDLAEVQSTFETGIREGENFLKTLTEQAAQGNFRIKVQGKVVLSKSRAEVLRMIMLNHVCHHRGQLSVYLRLLDIPVPSIYGPSADANPFA